MDETSQKAAMVDYIRAVVQDMLQLPTYALIRGEASLLMDELVTLKMNPDTDEATLDGASIRHIIYKSGLLNDTRSHGERPAKQWIKLLCTLELATAHEAERAYEFVFDKGLTQV